MELTVFRFVSALCLALLWSVAPTAAETVRFHSDDLTLKGYLCVPKGAGPFPAVVYNHGGAGNTIGGAPEATCEALAAAGFAALSPIRRATRSLRGHGDDVRAGLAYLMSVPGVDPDRIGMIGFSRGALLTYQAAYRMPSLKAAVIMGSGVTPWQFEDRIGDLRDLSPPLLLLVARNDTGSRRTRGRNPFAGMQEMHAGLKALDRDVELIVYPPYSDDGHTLFFSVGPYMDDVVTFLHRHL